MFIFFIAHFEIGHSCTHHLLWLLLYKDTSVKEECCFRYRPLEEPIISKISYPLGVRMRLKTQTVSGDSGGCTKASKQCNHSASRRSALAHPQGRTEVLCQASYAFPASPHMVSGPHGTHPASRRPR